MPKAVDAEAAVQPSPLHATLEQMPDGPSAKIAAALAAEQRGLGISGFASGLLPMLEASASLSIARKGRCQYCQRERTEGVVMDLATPGVER